MEIQLFPFLSTIEYAGKVDNISKTVNEHIQGAPMVHYYWASLVLEYRQ